MRLPKQQRFPWNLDWNLLRTFMVVIEQRSISKAADFLGRKQPTVSAALKRLEYSAGTQLVIRKPNEFSITRPGQILYGECVKIFGSISQLPSLLEIDATELRGHISIAIASSVASAHFDEMLSDFKKLHAHVTYSFSVNESDDVLNMITQNRASLGICLLSTTPKNLDSLILYREYFGLYCGPRHSLFDAVQILPDDLKGEPFVAFQTEDEGKPLQAISRLRAKLGLANNWSGVSSSLNEIRRMIIANIGIGALPLHVARHDVEEGRLRQLPPYDDLPQVDIFLISNPSRRQSEAEAAFLAACQKAFSAKDLSERTYIG